VESQGKHSELTEQGSVRCRSVVHVVSAVTSYHRDSLLSAVNVRKAELAHLLQEGMEHTAAEERARAV